MPQFVSMNPTRMCIYHGQSFEEQLTAFRKPRVMPSNVRKPQNGMSKKAKNRLRTALNWLVACSEKRNVKIKNGGIVKNFQISFITLTLPTKQMHSHQEIKSKCLNLFLTKLRMKFGVHNYVWKAELQKNGNIHFHLSIDKPIHYMIIRKYWNDAIAKLGYITAYARTYISMSFDEYCYWQNQNGIFDKKRLKKSYNYGKATNWGSPNTTDVKTVNKIENWASYMSKYMAKDPANREKTGIIADSLSELTGNVWYLSTSLSRLGSLKVEFSYEMSKIINQFANCKKVKDFTFDWCRLLYFRIKELPSHLRKFLRENLLLHAVKTGYQFPAAYPVW